MGDRTVPPERNPTVPSGLRLRALHGLPGLRPPGRYPLGGDAVSGGVFAEDVEAYHESGKCRMKVYAPSKQNLMAAVVHAFTYPKKLMTHDDPGMTARFLEAMTSARMRTWYGLRDS